MISKRLINKQYALYLCEAICLIVALYFVCYLLRHDNTLPISIGSAWACFSHWTKHFHVIAVALLPVYVALMIFGTAIAGIYLSSIIKRWFN